MDKREKTASNHYSLSLTYFLYNLPMAYLHSCLPDSRISLYKSQDPAFAIPIPTKPPNTVPIQPAASPIHSQWNFQKSRLREFKQQEEKDKVNHPDPFLSSDSLEVSSSKKSSPRLQLSFIGPTAPKGACVSSASLPESIFGHLCLDQRLHSQQTRIYFSSTSVRKHRPSWADRAISARLDTTCAGHGRNNTAWAVILEFLCEILECLLFKDEM